MEIRDAGMAIDSVDASRKSIKFDIEVYGDTVCPWSYLGKKSLDNAIQRHATQYPEDVFDIIWKPFILWPTAEISAYNKRAPMIKMVGPARAPGVFERLTSTAAEYGIHFNWEGLVGNSADSHKLIMLAYEIDQKLRQEQQHDQGEESSPNLQLSPPLTPDSGLSEDPSQPASILNQTQHAFLEALFYTTLTQGFDPSDRSFLVSLALAMDPPLASYPSEILAYLDSEDSTRKLGLERSHHDTHAYTVPQSDERQEQEQNDVRKDDDSVRNGVTHDKENASQKNGKSSPPPQHVVNAVPCVIVQGRYRVGGMQKPEVYLRVFEKVREGYLTTGVSSL